jgi:primosomal protein N'
MCGYCEWPQATQLEPCPDCSAATSATCARCDHILNLAADHGLIVQGGRVLRFCPYCRTMRSADIEAGTCAGCGAAFVTLGAGAGDGSRAPDA